MFVALRDITLLQAGYESLAPGAAEIGVGELEIAVSRDLRLTAPHNSLGPGLPAATPAQAAQALAAYGEAGLRVCALFLPNNFNAPDREAEIAWTVATVRLAEQLAVGVVRLEGATSWLERLTRRRRVQLYVEALHQVLAATAGSAVRLAVENHGREGNDPHWLEEVLAASPPERVGLALDPANLYWAGHPLAEVYALVERFTPRVCHVHAKNIAYPPEARERRRPLGWEYGCCVTPLGQGDLDYRRIAGVLQAAGYRGALALEEEALAHYPPAQRPDLLRRAVAHLREALG